MDWAADPASPSHIVINLDDFASVVDAVDALLRFRKAQPECRVIAVSAFVGGDDFGFERRAMCDATLRWPLSRGRFDAALRASDELSGQKMALHSIHPGFGQR